MTYIFALRHFFASRYAATLLTRRRLMSPISPREDTFRRHVISNTPYTLPLRRHAAIYADMLPRYAS